MFTFLWTEISSLKVYIASECVLVFLVHTETCKELEQGGTRKKDAGSDWKGLGLRQASNLPARYSSKPEMKLKVQ